MLLHTLLELAGTTLGAALYAYLRKQEGDPIHDRSRLAVLAGAAIGAAVGARLLWWLGEPGLDFSRMLEGKTVVGGLLGGLIGVELAKKWIGVRTRTGDLFVYPLMLAMVLGRVGCFLSGPADRTHGLPTDLPWGIAIGDGVRRHPVALYEIAFLLALVPLLRQVRVPGARFQYFLGSYLLFRFFVDFLKPFPEPLGSGLTAIQWACLAAAAWCGKELVLRERAAVTA
ncbi:MAG TPA: prolipoprotein diacylglyceryl transferase family protein [Thermoanaerobaculia bacterium]|nr:prolipoprotein diacylglyceryl transferase family protein [Thermoanaerobaculia bacterium]